MVNSAGTCRLGCPKGNVRGDRPELDMAASPRLFLIIDEYVIIETYATGSCSSTALLVSIRSALQADWQKPLFSSQCKNKELATRLG